MHTWKGLFLMGFKTVPTLLAAASQEMKEAVRPVNPVRTNCALSTSHCDSPAGLEVLVCPGYCGEACH